MSETAQLLAMNAEFFALAFTAALNPKLLAIDLLLIENRRPRAMFLCLLLGGMTTALTIGLLDVLTVHADNISSQGKVSAGVDLALGLLLLVLGALLATGRLHGRRRTSVPAGTGAGGETGEKGQLGATAAGRTKARAGHAGRRADRPARCQLHCRAAQPGGRKILHRHAGRRRRGLRHHRLLADHRPVRVPGTAARGHQGAPQAHAGLAQATSCNSWSASPWPWAPT